MRGIKERRCEIEFASPLVVGLGVGRVVSSSG